MAQLWLAGLAGRLSESSMLSMGLLLAAHRRRLRWDAITGREQVDLADLDLLDRMANLTPEPTKSIVEGFMVSFIRKAAFLLLSPHSLSLLADPFF